MGNQLFQYATAFALSKRKSEPLVLDTRFFDHYTLHGGYKLDHFNISARILSKEEESLYPNWQANLLLRYPIIDRAFKKWHVERQFTYQDRIYRMKRGQALLGYWQSELYFQEYRKEISAEFTLKEQSSVTAQQISVAMQGGNSVAVHIRRGDYLSNPSALRTHGICSLGYYNHAMSLLNERINDAQFYIFSDDIAWAKENIKIGKTSKNLIFIEGESVETDFWLMTQSKHHIIANSTFSWWGAWLANNTDEQLVICPSPWFDDKNLSETDLIPKSWIRLNKDLPV